MSYADAFARPPLRRPRMIGDTLVLGLTTILARREVVNGCWMVRQPNAAVLAALLSVAYEQPIAADDRLTRTVLRAIAQMPRNPRESEQSLSDLPDPSAAPETLELAARLLASGIRPETLAQAMRRAPLALPVIPLCANNLTLCEKGVVLGQTVVIPLADRPGGATGLDLAGREGRILALLSIGRLGLAPVRDSGQTARRLGGAGAGRGGVGGIPSGLARPTAFTASQHRQGAGSGGGATGRRLSAR